MAGETRLIARVDRVVAFPRPAAELRPLVLGEGGGGDGGRTCPSDPATTITCTPGASKRGTWSFHSIVKYGSTIFDARGRLSQIWNNSSGFALSRSISGNISACRMPRPAVNHCT